MIVIAYKPGQLANRLFLFAKFLAYGYENQVLIVNPSFDDYAGYFERTKRQLVPSSGGFAGPSSRRAIKLLYKISFAFGRVLHRLKIKNKFISITYLDWNQHYDLDTDKTLYNKGIHFIQGWEFDASRLMQLHKSKIITFFEPENSLKETIENFFHQFKHSQQIVGVHIRQGDYQFFEGGKYFFEVNEYKAIMLALLKKNPDVQFLICTNNKSISQIDFEGLNVTLAVGHELVDLFLLAKCNYIIGPPSTYSLWASYLGNVPLYQIESMIREIDLTDFKLV